MKIKRERQVRLDELLRYVWDNGIKGTRFESDNNSWVLVDEYRDIVDVYSIEKSDLFTITEEVEIDKETKLDAVVVYDEYSGNKNHIGRVFRTSIIQLNNLHNNGNIKFIYLQNPDGSIGELIWEDGEMVEN